jgi:hypothetical protein
MRTSNEPDLPASRQSVQWIPSQWKRVTIARLENEIQVADVDILIPLPTPIPVEEKAEWEARCKVPKQVVQVGHAQRHGILYY